MMRVAYVSVSDQLGGSEIAMLEAIKAVRRARPAWRLFLVLPGHGPLREHAAAEGVDCVVVPAPRAIAALGESGGGRSLWNMRWRASFAVRLARALASIRPYERDLRDAIAACDPHVVHTNGFKAHILGPRIAGGAALVWHLHEYAGPRPVTRRLLRTQARRCDAVIANSASVARDAAAALGLARPVAVVHNAVDLQRFHPSRTSGADLDALAGLPRPSCGVVRIGFVATFARWKGHEVFLRALAQLPAGAPVRGYIVGGPLYSTTGSEYSRGELETLARSLRLNERVGFTGYVPSVEAMPGLDIVVHASTRPEPFGLVIAEAMALGKAITTSAVGGAGEIVRLGVDAIGHEAGSPESLTASIARLAADDALRAKLGGQARAAAERLFDPRRLARDLTTTYESVAHLRAQRRCA
jgi:glycosyltransferase involved in cell wall biosynthesis